MNGTRHFRPGDLIRRNASHGRVWRVLRVEHGKLYCERANKPSEIATLLPARYHLVERQPDQTSRSD